MKKRLDVLLVDRGLATGRDRAKALIMRGIVYANDQKAQKSGDEYPEDTFLEVRGNPLPFVSRGGLKLEKAVKEFNLPVAGAICADIGASTGGFTDCLLSHGAVKVYAVDVGYGQLAWSLREDSRVVVLERTNARYLTNSQIAEPLRLITIDVSFISLTLLLPALSRLLCEDSHILCLVKPQFEAGKEHVGKKGVVRDPVIHAHVIEKVAAHAQEIGLIAADLDFSPIKGPQGNIEYLLHLRNSNAVSDRNIDAKAVVSRAVKALEEEHENSHLAEF